MHKKSLPVQLTLKGIMVSLLLVMAIPAQAQHDSTAINQAAQKKWIRKAASELRKEQSGASFRLIEASTAELPGFTHISYRVQERSGIRCLNGEWISLLPHSSHENPEIGDVCLAIAGRKEIFVNYGHICGGLVNYYSDKGKLPENAAAFFKDFRADTDDEPWTRLR